MSYEFRKLSPKQKKPKSNRWSSRQEKKMQLKSEKIKHEHIKPKSNLNNTLEWDGFVTRDDITLDSTMNITTLCIAWKQWHSFLLYNSSNQSYCDALLSDTIPKYLRGDFVVWDFAACEGSEWNYTILKRLPRENVLSRIKWNSLRFGSDVEYVIAANVDIAVLVFPVMKPKFDSKLLDRYLILCEYWKLKPLICINKIDLSDKRDPILEQYRLAWIPIVETSVLHNIGIDVLKDHLQNSTAVFLWKSGAGKSSLVNLFHCDIDTEIWDLNKKSWEWKHTTTTSSLYCWSDNSYVIDTPGVRSLWVSQISKDTLQNYFYEFAPYKDECKYSKCLHLTEPDCAIKNAVDKSVISAARYNSYVRIIQDLI